MVDMPFAEKLLLSQEMVRQYLSLYKVPAVSLSGGKDSTLVLYMVLQFKPDILVVFNNTGVEYPKTLQFIKQIQSAWNLNLIETKPRKTFWQCADQYGLMSSKKTAGFSHGGNCCQWLKEKPMREVIKELSIDLNFTGVTAVENRQRQQLALNYGDSYYTKTWQCRKVHPIMWWTEDEVLQYSNDIGIPLNPMYLPPYDRQRVGCMPCTAYKQWEKELQRLNPRMYAHLKLKKDHQYVMQEIFETGSVQ